MAGLSSLSSLEGRWKLDRDIIHGDGAVNRLTGAAHFHRAGARLIQDETGDLVLGNQTVKAKRRYIWAESKGRLDVFFDDMRPFHSVLLGVATHKTAHLCGPDRYEVSYEFSAWPKWTARWKVEGPKKDYVMTSRFEPQ